MKRTLSTLLIALSFACVPGFASQIFICQSCSSPPGGDPNLITGPGLFDVGVAGKGNDMQNPILVIVGVYDGTSTSAAPTLDFGGMSLSPSGVGDWGETTDMAGLAAGQDAYVQLGFTDPNGGHSETFDNWNTGETSNGFAAATSFELFDYVVPAGISGGSTIDLGVIGAPAGSYVIAFSCKTGGPSAGSGLACPNGDVGSTPFTNAGLITGLTSVPEPGTLVLLGTAVLAIGFARRRLA